MPWELPPVTDDQLRNPLNLIPPDQRPRVVLRFSDQSDLLVSGLLDGGTDIAQRPVVVDDPVGKGHVVLFANNPIYRGETIGSYFLVFNAILNFDHLDAGRSLAPQVGGPWRWRCGRGANDARGVCPPRAWRSSAATSARSARRAPRRWTGAAPTAAANWCAAPEPARRRRIRPEVAHDRRRRRRHHRAGNGASSPRSRRPGPPRRSAP